MAHEISIHTAQTQILRELLFMPSTNFAALQKSTGLESDHVKFHIKRLVELGYVSKHENQYALTTRGKEYANKIDTEAGTIERQPKSAVILVVERATEKGKEYLVQERLKHPYFGFWGFPSGKVRWGETIMSTARRELEEETGLSGNFSHSGVYHERVVQAESGEIIEDKIFHVMFCNVATGKLQEAFEGGRNTWRTLESVHSEIKRYKSFDEEATIALDRIPFTEAIVEYGDEF